MKFLLDQNISIKTAEFLRSLSIDVSQTNEIGLKGKDDEEIYDYCKTNSFILLTFDHGFGFRYLSKKDLKGLVILRIYPQIIEVLHNILQSFFIKVKKKELILEEHITIIENTRIRSRKVV